MRGGMDVRSALAAAGRTTVSALGLCLAISATPSGAAAFQQRVPRDTVTPHFARFRDELPEQLAAISSVLQAGLDASARAAILADLRAIAPSKPVGRTLPPGRQFIFTTRFRGRDVPATLAAYWPDTATVGFRVRSTDLELVDAVDSVVHVARASGLAKPTRVRLAVKDGEGYDGSTSRIEMSIGVDPAPHCPGFGLERSIERRGDTIAVHIDGVAPPGRCPTPTLRSDGFYVGLPSGRYVVAFDASGDTNVVLLHIADTSVSLKPQRVTYVDADRAVHWRIPTASFVLRCNRAAGDPRLCDALHEWVSRRPGVTPARFDTSGVSPLGYSSAEERVVVYRYRDEPTVTAVRRCVASIPQQLRLASWVALRIHAAAGTWQHESAHGSASSSGEGVAAILDGTGSIPSDCGAPTVASGAVPMPSLNAAALRPPHVTVVSTFGERGEPTTIEARSDGWIAMTPLISPFAPEPYPTTHLYATASDALRWVERVRAVVGDARDSSAASGASAFIPPLGRGSVHARTLVALDSARRPTISFSFEDCAGMGRQYHLDQRTLLELASDVERAARIAFKGSPIATTPSLGRPFYADEASCRASPSPRNAAPTYPVDATAEDKSVNELGVRFVVDSTGRVDAGSVAILPGATARMADAARRLVSDWRYRPAQWGGVPVAQYVTTALAFDAGAPIASRPQVAPQPGTRHDIPGVRRYPLRIAAPENVVSSRVEVLASVVVDTNGVADRSSLVTLPGTPSAVIGVLRSGIAERRFAPATRDGRKVAARATGVWLVEPLADCLGEDAGPECPNDDQVLAMAPRPTPPPALLRPSAFYDIRAEVAPVDESQQLPSALGLPSLGKGSLPTGTREIRIYSGLVIAYPHSALIVRQERGAAGKVTGRLVQYWPVNDTAFTKTHDSEAMYASSTAGRCDEPRRGDGVIACTVRFTQEPDWRRLLRLLDSVRAWDLPDESQVPSRGRTIDGWVLRVEARRGATYRRYQYHNPEVYRPPEGTNALKLMLVVDSLFQLTRPPRALQLVHGIYFYGPDTSDFVRCGRSEKPGRFEGQLGPIRRFLGDSAWKARSAPNRALEVEAWVRRRVPDEPRERGRQYPRTWQVDSVTTVRPSPTRQCQE